MFQLKKDHVVILFSNVVYFSLLCLGILFIYYEDIVQRFKTGRTNFAQYSENMTEMPSMVTGNLTFHITLSNTNIIFREQNYFMQMTSNVELSIIMFLMKGDVLYMRYFHM